MAKTNTDMDAHVTCTLRDWFAGMAMQGFFAHGGTGNAEAVAHAAYMVADGMLAKREELMQNGKDD